MASTHLKRLHFLQQHSRITLGYLLLEILCEWTLIDQLHAVFLSKSEEKDQWVLKYNYNAVAKMSYDSQKGPNP